jgi:protein-tyrosine kinase
LCDFVVLVVEYGKVTPGKLKEAVDGVGKEKLAGVVFNREPEMFLM